MCSGAGQRADYAEDMGKRSAPASDAAAATLSGAGLLVSCLPMVAMLPGVAGGALGLVGLGATSALVSRLAPALNVVAQPLLLFSVALLVVACLRCGSSVVALALGGGVLLYLSMYVWTDASGSTSPALFYPGLVGFLGASVVSWLRRRSSSCRPLVSQRLGARLLIATVMVGILAVAGYAAIVGGPGPTMPMMVGF